MSFGRSCKTGWPVGSAFRTPTLPTLGIRAVPGDGSEASRNNHAHRVPIDNTLEFNASDELGVNVQDVIEHLQERIQYHTASSNYSSSAGATVGQIYQTPANTARSSHQGGSPLKPAGGCGCLLGAPG